MSRHDETCPAGCRCNGCKAEETAEEQRKQMTALFVIGHPSVVEALAAKDKEIQRLKAAAWGASAAVMSVDSTVALIRAHREDSLAVDQHVTSKANAESDLAAERAKVRELREWLQGAHTKRCMVYQAKGHSYDGGMCDGFDRVQTELDALGLTGEAQP